MSFVEEKTMQSRNMSQRELSQIFAEALSKRSYCVPHVIYDLPLVDSDLSILHVLFKLQDDFLFKSKGHWTAWFFATNKLLAGYSKRSVSTIKRARCRLKYLGIIDYRLGSWKTKRATEYRILIDNFYLADRLSEGVKDE